MRHCSLERKRRENYAKDAEKKIAFLGFLFCGFCEFFASFAFNSLHAQGAST